MSLRQEIVVVSEYTVKAPSSGKASRGSSPGAYVERYMARAQATEPLAPVTRHRTDDFIMRYMARESAVERASSRAAVKHRMRDAQRQGGVAFGYGSVSLSDDQLKAASKDIQKYFDAGHTVMKTVLSFDEDYLRRHGIVDEDFRCQRRGDYRGQIDQMKLRMALMHGLQRMGSDFDDLRYVGVIQVDTEHVHCHLAMTDAGRGTVTTDGTQRGKLLERHKSRLRRGLDAWLDEKQVVARLSSTVGSERRNVTTFIKRWAHERMQTEALPQFLLTCLPADRSLWRATSKHTAMRKPNRLVRELVLEQLHRDASPMPQAMEQVRAYANRRRETEQLDLSEWEKLVEHGREQILERAVNAVYQILRSLPEDELRIRTPMLDVMGMDYEQLAATVQESHTRERGSLVPPVLTQHDGDDLRAFGLRLRRYALRLEHHRDRAQAYRDLSRDWEKADRAGVAAAESRPLYDFYRFEENYHTGCMAKYQHFLPFAVGPDQAGRWYDRQKGVADYGRRMLDLIALRRDASLQRMKDAEEAERLGREIYDQPGGHLLTQGKPGRSVLDVRIATMRDVYDERLADLKSDLARAGLGLAPTDGIHTVDETHVGQVARVGGDGQRAGTATEVFGDDVNATTIIDASQPILPNVARPFGEVKALDLHHLGYDFPGAVQVGDTAQQHFITEAYKRRQLLVAAMEYLDRSAQAGAIADLPVDDTASMIAMARNLEADVDGRCVLPSRLAELRERADVDTLRRSNGVALDGDLGVRVREQVDEVVAISAAEPYQPAQPGQ